VDVVHAATGGGLQRVAADRAPGNAEPAIGENATAAGVRPWSDRPGPRGGVVGDRTADNRERRVDAGDAAPDAAEFGWHAGAANRAAECPAKRDVAGHLRVDECGTGATWPRRRAARDTVERATEDRAVAAQRAAHQRQIAVVQDAPAARRAQRGIVRN